MVKTKITVNIPTYRRPRLLKRAIKSVLRQTYPHFLIRVYDNCSGDETAKVVRELQKADDRIQYFCQSENLGAAANFQTAREKVQTPYFSFLSDDDILLPNSLEMAMAGMEAHHLAAFSGSATLVMTPWGQVLMKMPSSIKKSRLFLPPQGFKILLKGGLEGHLVWSSLVFSTEKSLDLPPFSSEKGVPLDVLFVLLLSSRHPFFFNPNPGAIFILPGIPGVSSIDENLLAWPQAYEIFKTALKDPLGDSEEISDLFRKQIGEFYTHLIWKMFYLKDFKRIQALQSILREELNYKFKCQRVEFFIRQLSKWGVMEKIFRWFYLKNEKRKKKSQELLQKQYSHFESFLSVSG